MSLVVPGVALPEITGSPTWKAKETRARHWGAMRKPANITPLRGGATRQQ